MIGWLICLIAGHDSEYTKRKHYGFGDKGTKFRWEWCFRCRRCGKQLTEWEEREYYRDAE